MKKKSLLHAILFSIIGVLLFWIVQGRLTEKTYMSRVFKSLEQLEDESVEVLFLGTSHMQGGILPMQLYEETGIVSFNLGTSVQQLDETYYLLEYALQKQSPDLVVIDASNLFNDMNVRSIHRRYIMDAAPTWDLKVKLAKQYAACEDSDGIMGALIPLVEYHSRWDELSQSDFQIVDETFDYMAGNGTQAIIVAAEMSLEEVNDEAEWMLSKTPGYSIAISNGNRAKVDIDTEIYTPVVDEKNHEWLLKIKELCDENGIEMLLTKIPTQISSVEYMGAWTVYRSNAAKAVADECGITFWDITYDSELELDFAVDTFDGGGHLNFLGAEKATACMQEYIKENYDITTGSNEIYDEALEKYKCARELAHLQMETDFSTYLEKLVELDNVKVIVVACDEWVEGLNEDDISHLEDLGLQLSAEADWGDSYLAVIENGTVLYEQLSDRMIGYSYEDDFGNDIAMTSAGHYHYNGAYTAIAVNDTKYATENKGLNFIVWDNEANVILDSVNFDTSSDEKIGAHNRTVLKWPSVVEREW